MTLTQEDVIAGPDAMVMWFFGIMRMAVIMPMIVTVIMSMVMIAMLMGMTVRMPIQGVIVRHGASLACYQRKNS
jgi:hypothetical protein